MKKIIQGIVIVVFMTTNAFAEESNTSEHSKLIAFAILETAAIANSYAASKSPGGYAAGMIILYPLIEKPANTKEFWGGWAAISIIPAYNFYLDRQLEKGVITRKDIFEKNMIAWNLLGGIAYLLIQGEEEAIKPKEDDGLKMGLMPIKDGMQLSMRYQF